MSQTGRLSWNEYYLYESPDCIGQEFVRGLVVPTVVGSVFMDRPAEQILYIPIDYDLQSIEVASIKDTSEFCSNYDPAVPFDGAAIPLPNNSDITGIRDIGTTENRYPVPLTLRRP